MNKLPISLLAFICFFSLSGKTQSYANKWDSLKNVFHSKTHEPWQSGTYKISIYEDFLPDFKPGSYEINGYASPYCFSGNELEEVNSLDVHFIEFGHSNEGISYFIKEGKRFSHLEAISINSPDVSFETLEAIIEVLKGQKHFRKLLLGRCKFRSLPENITDLENLEVLSLTGCNRILELPDSLHRLNKLIYLDVRNTILSEFPENLGELRNLTFLGMSGAYITSLPESIGQCTNLCTIEANASRLSYIPPSIGNCTNMVFMNLGYARISKIPKEMGALSKMKSLHLGHNPLTDIPDELSELKELGFLSAEHCKLTTFPKAVLGMTSCQTVWLNDNLFTNVPIEVADLPALAYLTLELGVVSEHDIDEIKRLRPELRIFDHD